MYSYHSTDMFVCVTLLLVCLVFVIDVCSVFNCHMFVLVVYVIVIVLFLHITGMSVKSRQNGATHDYS